MLQVNSTDFRVSEMQCAVLNMDSSESKMGGEEPSLV